MAESIKEVMMREHAKINAIVLELEESIKVSVDVKKKFYELRAFLKNHFMIEDEAIFSIFSTMKEKDVSIVFDLMQEHGVILGYLNDIEKNLNKNLPVDLGKFKQSFLEHSRVEDRFFYPNLEKELNENQREFIISKVRALSGNRQG